MGGIPALPDLGVATLLAKALRFASAMLSGSLEAGNACWATEQTGGRSGRQTCSRQELSNMLANAKGLGVRGILNARIGIKESKGSLKLVEVKWVWIGVCASLCTFHQAVTHSHWILLHSSLAHWCSQELHLLC